MPKGYNGSKSSKSSNAVVIIEPRPHKFLRTVLLNYDSILDSSWDFYIFHGKSSQKFAESAVKGISKKKGRQIFIKPLHTDNLNADEYNELLKQATFWNRVDAENIFLLQTDAVLCRNSDFNIYDFINHDYIGCSIDDKSIGKHQKYWDKENFYGVGGMSFRKKSFMLKWIAENPNIRRNFPEDIFFSNGVAKTRRRPKKASDMAKFCTQWRFTYKSFGAHQTKLMGKSKDKEAFEAYCPEVKSIDQ